MDLPQRATSQRLPNRLRTRNPLRPFNTHATPLRRRPPRRYRAPELLQSRHRLRRHPVRLRSAPANGARRRRVWHAAEPRVSWMVVRGQNGWDDDVGEVG